jgi:predicted transposase/invertase (TIGR01784 family)
MVGLKSCRLDIRAITSKNHQINVEIQILNRRDMEKRSLFYSSRLYAAQLKEGEEYRELNKTIAVNILDFSRPTSTKLHSVYRLLEVETGEELTDALEIHFLELPRLKENPLDFDCPLTRWMMVLSDETTRKHKEAILMQDENIRKAYEDLGRLSADKDIQRLYQIREDAARDYRSGMSDARLQGLEEGLEKGLERGRQEGRQEKLRLVKKMLAQGIDEEMIKEAADLTQAELDAIKKD